MLQDSGRFPTPKDGHAYDTGGAGNLVNSQVWGSGSSLAAVIMSRFCTILYAEVRVDFASNVPKEVTCPYVLSLVCLGIVHVYSVHLIASLGIHGAEKPVSSQDAFVCHGCHLHIFAQALRVAEGHSCPCPCGSHERVYRGQISVISSQKSKKVCDITSADCPVVGICALLPDRTGRYILAICAPIHAVSFHFFA